jgi:hypothetical protein
LKIFAIEHLGVRLWPFAPRRNSTTDDERPIHPCFFFIISNSFFLFSPPPPTQASDFLLAVLAFCCQEERLSPATERPLPCAALFLPPLSVPNSPARRMDNSPEGGGGGEEGGGKTGLTLGVDHSGTQRHGPEHGTRVRAGEGEGVGEEEEGEGRGRAGWRLRRKGNVKVGRTSKTKGGTG